MNLNSPMGVSADGRVAVTATPVLPHAARGGDHAADRAFCDRALAGVSRTFALTIRLLPRRLEYPVLVSYLLCRIADTVEDSPQLTLPEQLRLLEDFRAALRDPANDVPALRAAFVSSPSADGELMRNADRALREFHRMGPALRDAIRPWVEEMCTGMAQFLERHEGTAVRRLSSVAELERYCYFVAGTVGHMLTDLFRWHAPMTAERYQRLRALATEFGLGLQLTNIIKDVSSDLSRGVSYIPRELVQGEERGAIAEALRALVERTWKYLAQARDYCTLLPRRQYGIRLFCLTSLFFAAKTLRLARRDPGRLGRDDTLKITRGDVYRTLAATMIVAPVNALVRSYFAAIAGPAEAQPSA